jgi:hypothetical protein
MEDGELEKREMDKTKDFLIVYRNTSTTAMHIVLVVGGKK